MMPGLPWRKSATTCPAADNAGKTREQSEIGVCLDKVVIPSGAKRSRGIYAFRFAFWVIWREDPSTPLRSAQDDKVFCCLGLPEKHQFVEPFIPQISECFVPELSANYGHLNAGEGGKNKSKKVKIMLDN